MKTTFFTICIHLIALITFASCMDNDVYNPDNKQEGEKLTDLDVPDGFIWSTTQQVNVTVGVTGQNDTEYSILIYPQNYDKETLPLTAGKAKKGAPYNSTITFPAADTVVTVVQRLRYKDGEIMQMRRNAPIVNNKVNVDFNTVATSTRTVTRTTGASTRALSNEDIANIKNATPISGKTEIDKNGSDFYIVKPNESYTLKVSSNMGNNNKKTIYVAGTMDVSEIKSTENLHYGHIIVLSEEQIKAAGYATATGSGLIIGSNFFLKNGLSLDNYGKIDIRNNNDDEDDNDDATLGISIDSRVHNWGCIYASEIILNKNGEGNTRANEVTEFYIEEGGYVEVEDMYIEAPNGKFDIVIKTNGFLYVKDDLSFKGNASIRAEGSNITNSNYVGLVKVEDFEHAKENGSAKKYTINIDPKLYVIWEDKDDNDEDEKYYISGNPTIGNSDTAAKEAGITIPKTSCYGGFNPGGNESGSDDNEEIATGIAYSYAFEDLWPNYGDYDMNDFVLETQPAVYIKKNHVTKIEFKGCITAIGANKRIAAAIQWDNIPAGTIANVTHSNAFTQDGNVFNCTNGIENNQNGKVIIPIFEDAHTFCNISNGTIAGSRPGNTLKKEFTITVEFTPNSAISPDLFNKEWNIFIISEPTSALRKEIHLIDKPASSLFNPGKDTGIISDQDHPFKSKEGLCWAMAIPGSFNFPLEGNEILSAYTDFKEWVISGGAEKKEWYKTPVPGKTHNDPAE